MCTSMHGAFSQSQDLPLTPDMSELFSQEPEKDAVEASLAEAKQPDAPTASPEEEQAQMLAADEFAAISRMEDDVKMEPADADEAKESLEAIEAPHEADPELSVRNQRAQERGAKAKAKASAAEETSTKDAESDTASEPPSKRRKAASLGEAKPKADAKAKAASLGEAKPKADAKAKAKAKADAAKRETRDKGTKAKAKASAKKTAKPAPADAKAKPKAASTKKHGTKSGETENEAVYQPKRGMKRPDLKRPAAAIATPTEGKAHKRGRRAVTLHTCQLRCTNDVGVKWAVYSYGKGRQPTPKGQRCQRCAVFVKAVAARDWNNDESCVWKKLSEDKAFHSQLLKERQKAPSDSTLASEVVNAAPTSLVQQSSAVQTFSTTQYDVWHLETWRSRFPGQEPPKGSLQSFQGHEIVMEPATSWNPPEGCVRIAPSTASSVASERQVSDSDGVLRRCLRESDLGASELLRLLGGLPDDLRGALPITMKREEKTDS